MTDAEWLAGMVSIASSSANTFRPKQNNPYVPESQGLNRFFISEYFPAEPRVGGPRWGLCLNRFFISEYFPAYLRSDASGLAI